MIIVQLISPSFGIKSRTFTMEDRMIEKFRKLVDQVGIVLTVKILEKKYRELSNEGISSLTFSEWKDVYKYASSDSELKEFALQKMLELAKTFSECKDVYKYASSDSELKEFAFQKMSELADF